MASPAPSQVTAAYLMAQLVADGVQHVFLAPGSRSQALAIAADQLAKAGRIRLHVRLDERSMAFQALGVAKATQTPVAVITTSGTAVANLYPAVLEAHHTSAPLILLTADRPAELRGTGSNQTTNQIGIFAEFATCIDLEAGAGEGESSLAASRALEATQFGPVQVNVALREPLSALEPNAANLTLSPSKVLAGAIAVPETIDLSIETIIIAGDGASEIAGADDSIAAPIFAEPTSGWRAAANSQINYRWILKQQSDALNDVKQIVIFGKPTLSREVQALLKREGVRTYSVAGHHKVFNPSGSSKQVQAVNFVGANSAWLAKLAEANSTVQSEAVGHSIGVSRAQLIGAVYQATQPSDCIVFGASRLIREADFFAPAKQVTTFANRGLAGIDGTIGFAQGIALTSKFSKTRLVLGDLAAIHDAGSLASNADFDLQVIVGNDRGGRIFEGLEMAKLLDRATFEELFVTEQSVDFEALARAYGFKYSLIIDATQLAAALSETGKVLIEVQLAN